MTTERKEGRFRREMGSHLFRRMTTARFTSLLGIRNPPTLSLPAPIPLSNGPYPASSVTSSYHGSGGKHAQATVQHDHKIISTSLQPQPPRSANTVQTIPQTSKPSSDEFHEKSSVSSSHDSNENRARATAQDNRGTVTTTPPFKRRTPTPQRVRSQDWESSQPRDGTDYTSFGGALASQDPLARRQETVPHGTRLPPSGRINRMNSENIFGSGGTPRFGPFLIPEPGQMPVEGKESRPRSLSILQSLLFNERYAVGRCPISP